MPSRRVPAIPGCRIFWQMDDQSVPDPCLDGHLDVVNVDPNFSHVLLSLLSGRRPVRNWLLQPAASSHWGGFDFPKK